MPTLYTVEHGLSPDGRMLEGSPSANDGGFSTFFSETSSGKHVPRSLYIDLEPNVIDEVKNRPYRSRDSCNWKGRIMLVATTLSERSKSML